MAKYVLNVARDVDTDEPDGPILNLPAGYRFVTEVVHVRSYANMRQLRQGVKNEVIACDCAECVRMLAKQKGV